MGHDNFYFAGELDPPDSGNALLSAPVAGTIVDERAHFKHPAAVWISNHAFATIGEQDQLRKRIDDAATKLRQSLLDFIKRYDICVLVSENVFALPLNLPLSVALRRVVSETGIPTIAHNHDFYWERDRFSTTNIDDILDSTFPPGFPNIQQVVINTRAQRELSERGIKSMFVPNVFDFENSPAGPDDYNSDLRAELGLDDDDLLFLQPTRVVRRKGIELAIDLVRRLEDRSIKLIITHPADPAESNSVAYLEELLALAARARVDLRYLPHHFAPQRGQRAGVEKVYSLWDGYVFADFVTYPTLYEGFGNALLETLYFRKPMLVNRYSVYQDDIEPIGLDVVSIDGEITDNTVASVRTLLSDADRVEMLTANNARLAQKHFSYEVLERHLKDLLDAFG